MPIIARLLLAKPSVPEDNKKGSLLNKLIIMTIPYLLEDDEVFYAACRYSRKCMLHLQDNPYIVRVFYNTPYTVNTVLRIALQRDDDLGCCAVKLLYVSVKLQVSEAKKTYLYFSVSRGSFFINTVVLPHIM